MFKKIIKDKRILTFYIIVIVGLILGITYALSTTSLALNVNTALVGLDDYVYGNTTFDSSNIDFKPILDTDVETSPNNVIKIEFTVGGASTNTASNIIYDIALTDLILDCNLLSPYIKWKLINTTTSTTYTGSLDYKFDTIKDGRLVLTSIQEDLPNYSANQTGYHNYTFYMWFSDSCQDSDINLCGSYEDQSALLNKYFSGKVEVELYTESKKALVRNPSATLNTSTCNNSNNETFTVNAPNLDNNNLIPVYYDDTVLASDGTYGVWKKADSENANNSWYDYENKMWANAVLIGDSTKKRHYQSAGVGATIADADITAFYVWIPRYKYRVWNINRQGTSEDKYAYSAYTSGIQIEFEKGTGSTGNVTCSYDDQTEGSAIYLNDNCSVNGTAVAYNTSNLTYGESNQAWYTHPAFTFGDGSDKNKTGFWIGKFETSSDTLNSDNIAETPTILPDVQSLRSQLLSEQFMSAKNFQSYLQNSSLDAHMLTNLEWGAVAYLTHSIYGLCDGSTCSGVNNNNSSEYYTGRSSGTIADGTYSMYGTYNYKGYTLSDNTPTGDKNITLVASTTKNITGVYDMSGGAGDYVMGNEVSSSKVFYPTGAGVKWEGTAWYDSTNSRLYSKYYNSYAYYTSDSGTATFNRARLGDATAEVLGGTTTSSAWKPGTGEGITGSFSLFVNNSSSWFAHGGYYRTSGSGAFSFNAYGGASNGLYSFRSSLS